MESSKLHLSPAELTLFCNAEIILTKNRVIKKIILILEEVQSKMLLEENTNEVFKVSPKISKGENHDGLPYVILDYPRISDGNQNLFFIRSMFWWGNFYSSTLHLSGRYKHSSLDKLSPSFDLLSAKEFHIGINTDPWVHHFKDNNYRKISSLSGDEYRSILKNQEHIKVAAYWPLSELDNSVNYLYESWRTLLRLVA